MKCVCKNCKHRLEHSDGKVCGKHLVFVQEEDYCMDFENGEFFDPTNLVLFTFAVVVIVLILSKIL